MNRESRKVEIIPAILPKDFAEVEEKTSLVKGLVKIVQIDVCDGQFTPQATWPYKKEDDSFEKILKEEDGLPGWDKLDFEIDLMVSHPEEVVDDWVTAGALRIIVHAESGAGMHGLGERVRQALTKLDGRVEVGLALNIEGPLAAVEAYRDQIQFVQYMGIDRIGYQGEPFDPAVLDKVRALKAAFPDLPVSVDGGVTLETGALLVEAGVDRLVAGSAIFAADNFTEAIQKFKALGR